MSDHRSSLEAALAGRYRLVRELGRGGAATVWLAEDLQLGRRVALKVLHPELASSLGPERFLREIAIAANLAHPHILPLHESGRAGDFLYYAMPFVEGESLRDRLEREVQLPVEDAVRIAREVAEGLGYAHAHGIVHRDIKPENILLQDGHALVADFGVARAIESAGGERLTSTGLAVGTPAYMSPEQAGAAERIDGRSDLYSLGCVLYEMLSGEPPFTGATPQALAAKHLHASPQPLRLARAAVPARLERVVERALAKAPADRFARAADMRRALEDESPQPDDTRQLPSPSRPPEGRSTGRHAAGAGALLLLAALAIGLWYALRQGTPALDPNRVVVFPLRDNGPGRAEGTDGEAVATYIGYALDGSEPLRWLDGWDRLGHRERSGLVEVSSATAARISRAEAARYFIDGSIIRTPDSIAVVLRLHDVQGDSVVARAGSSGPAAGANLPARGLEAVSRLLPALLEPGRAVDLRGLADRRPSAVAAFLQGERNYRRMNFSGALPLYQRAVAADSGLVVAALKGAWSALWEERTDEARQLVHGVLARPASLPPRYLVFARGIADYLDGAADSAAAHFRAAVRLDSTWVEAWTALGEVHYHLLPRPTPGDSTAEYFFGQAARRDSTFSPALIHLAYEAVQRGNLDRAGTLLAPIRSGNPEQGALTPLDLMRRCVREGPDRIDWSREASDSLLLAVARGLSPGLRQAGCAAAAYHAALASTAITPARRWGALLGLQGILAAQGRVSEASALLDSEASLALGGDALHLVLAAAGYGDTTRAAEVARRYGARYESLPTANLWAIGLWMAHERDADGLAKVLDVVAGRGARPGARRDSLVAESLRAQHDLLLGDSSGALARLRALTPNAPPGDLEWQPWEALGPERSLLADLLLARGELAEAAAVAAQFDSPQPVIYAVYLPASLQLRYQAAQGLDAPGAAQEFRRRLMRLRGSAPAQESAQPQTPR